MEMQIIALGYPDAFVQNGRWEVKVTVLSTEGHSRELADEITHYVMTNWEDAQV